ncbi:hypothetical protein OYC64_007650 [Pagothenia borchgrevinki]|uniref:Uncharacterized protein n=1 Tax=Pagothenia borchgrevinki TaxID=8213 RepID=A0ABD2GTJ9_PAGBO
MSRRPPALGPEGLGPMLGPHPEPHHRADCRGGPAALRPGGFS